MQTTHTILRKPHDDIIINIFRIPRSAHKCVSPHLTPSPPKMNVKLCKFLNGIKYGSRTNMIITTDPCPS